MFRWPWLELSDTISPEAQMMSMLLYNLCIAGLLLLIVGQWFRQVPDDRLSVDSGILRLRPFEADRSFYEDRLHIKRWKDHLPETGGWFGGVPKRELPARSVDGLSVFAIECRRGERTHWTLAAVSPLFLVVNERTTGLVLTSMGAMTNGPFILVLRYNRVRILAALARRRPAAELGDELGGDAVTQIL